MKTLFFVVLMSLSGSVFASTFCNGFAKGFESGYKQHNNTSLSPMTPLCPLKPLKSFSDPASDYEFGYNKGYLKGLSGSTY